MWCIPPEQNAELVCAMENVLSRQCMDTRIPDRETLAAQTQAWQRDRTNMNVIVNWQFPTKKARIKLRRL